MNELANIVNIVVSENTRGVTQVGFGTPHVIGVHTNTQEDVKTYAAQTVLADMVTDGFSVYDPIYREVASIVGNTTKPKYIKVGKLLTAYTCVFTLTIEDNVVTDKVYAFTLIAPDGSETTISYTALVTDDHEDVATALTALITAVSDITAVAVAEVITCTADNTNESWYCSGINPRDIRYACTSVDTNIATELTALQQEDNDWYVVHLADCPSNARLTALATYIQTQEKLHLGTTHDWVCLDSTSTTDVMYVNDNANRNRTVLAYSTMQNRSLAAAWGGKCLPFTPGSINWAYQEISGIDAETYLTPAQTLALRNKHGNYYSSIQDLANTFNGTTCGAKWIDEVRGRDHFVQRTRERIYVLFSNNPKIPFTDSGIEQIVGELKAQIKESGDNGYIDKSRGVVYNYPTAAEVSSAYKADRVLPGVSVEYYPAGAINAVDPLTVVVQY